MANHPEIGSCELLGQVGQGEIATVLQAVDTASGHEVAVKVLRPDSVIPTARAFFENEVDVLSRLHHAHIPEFYRKLSDNPLSFSFQLINGKDLRFILKHHKGFMSPKVVVPWMIQMCDVLDYLHNHNPPLAFRDLKPPHIMIDRKLKAWLVDYNLTRILPPSKVLMNADAAGTSGYAAPEQYYGLVSPRVDIYALGATMHNLLTAIDPAQERHFTYAPPRSINKSLSKELSAVIMKALSYEPEDRYASADEMKAALMACL